MSNTNDTDITKLHLNDTFYDWYTKTNQIIDYVNPINIYDVFAGNGLQESRTGTPGTIELNVATNPSYFAIDTQANTDGISEVILNIAALSSGTVANTSVFAFSGNTSGTQLYKVAASDMLPPTINGNHTFSGTITVGDLIVNDGNITINYTGANRDNAGIILEGTDTNINNVSFTYDTDTSAWYSSENMGIKSGKYFRTDSPTSAIFPFYASNTQGTVDLQLVGTVGATTEKWSVKGEWGNTVGSDSLTFAHYTNGSLTNSVMELQSNGSGTSNVLINDTITITDILNSSPFSQTPTTTVVPVTDSTNGYLNSFVNRIKATIITGSGVQAGHIVKIGNSSGQVNRAQADSTEALSQSIGIVESVSGTTATIITGGTFSVSPRNSSNTQFPMTAGNVYYLDQGSTNYGCVTATKPSSGIVKALLVATGTTSGIFIPDFTNTALAGLITNAFSSVYVTDTGETVNAVLSDSLVLTGGDNVSIDVNSNGDVVINSTADALPAASTYSMFLTQGTTTATSAAINSYSVVGRTLAGNIGSITVNPGGLLGRKDDTDDSNNPVESLSPSDVRNLLGFSGSNYVKTVSFKSSAGSTIHDFTANSLSTETVNVRAGDNVTFTYSSVDDAVYINSTGGGTNGGGGNPLDISSSYGPGYAADVTSMTFESGWQGTGTQYIDFFVRKPTNGIGYVSARPASGILSYSGDTGSGSFTAGNTLKIKGDATDGVSVGYQTVLSKNNTFTVSLADTIRIAKLSRNSSPYVMAETDPSAPLILSNGVDSDRNTLMIFDVTRPDATSRDEYSIKLNAFDSIADQDAISPGRVSSTTYSGFSTGLRDKCISLYADVSHGGNTVSYPFKFYKLIADAIEVKNLTVTDTAIKNALIVDNITGFTLGSELGLSNVSEIEVKPEDSASSAILFKFNDQLTANSAYIVLPTGTASLTLKPNSLVMSERVYFCDSTDITDFSPSIGWSASTGKLDINSLGSDSVLQFSTDLASEIAYFGLQSGKAIMQYFDGTTTRGTFELTSANQAKLYNIDALFIRASSTGAGWRFNTTTSFTSTDVGKSLYVSSTASGVATVSAGFVIKPYASGATVATDPINTLYYTT